MLRNMSELGALRNEVDTETAKIKLALLKYEVRVEMKKIIPKVDADKMVSLIRKIYVKLYEKLLAVMVGISSDKGLDDFRRIRYHWKHNFYETKAVMERLEEIVQAIEKCHDVNFEGEQVKFYLNAINDVLENPPLPVFIPFNDESDLGSKELAEEEEEENEDEDDEDDDDLESDSYYSATSDPDEEYRIPIPEYTYLSARTTPSVGIGPSKKALMPTFTIKPGDYSLQSDRFHRNSPISQQSRDSYIN